MFNRIKSIFQNSQKALSTDFKRKFKNSGQLSATNTLVISSGEVFVFTLDKRFIPYDDVNLVNLSKTSNVLIEINNHHISSLPRGNSTIINNRNITDVRVKNISSDNIEIGEIQLFYEHTGAEGDAIIDKVKAGVGIASSIKILRGGF